MKSLALGGAALTVLLCLGSIPAHAAPQPHHDASASSPQGRTLSLKLMSDSRRAADDYVECSWSNNRNVAWWWEDETLTEVQVEATGRVECDPDIQSIESELYVQHDETRNSVDTDTCDSDDDAECATSTTTGTYTCTEGTACAGDWTSRLELRLELDDTSWDADSFPDYCSIEGDDDEIARCSFEGRAPVHVPATFPPTTAATPSS
ncbi:hypothetical protein ACH4GE_40955 [Streptomyces tendae]|uniref:hypothetical protein n=1 Tax=Streptomyces tendae TaxID=1932 RepID=UPI0037B917ED